MKIDYRRDDANHIAAALLYEYAAEIEVACESGKKPWSCKDCDHLFLCQKRRYEEVMEAARDLTKPPRPWWLRIFG